MTRTVTIYPYWNEKQEKLPFLIYPAGLKEELNLEELETTSVNKDDTYEIIYRIPCSKEER